MTELKSTKTDRTSQVIEEQYGIMHLESIRMLDQCKEFWRCIKIIDGEPSCASAPTLHELLAWADSHGQ